jgi:DNA-binding winged helix-turn-helix (wHTH) protein/predicted ATPase
MVYRFGTFELDDQRFELRREGSAVPIQRRAFDLLHYLVRRPDVVVSKQELRDFIWAGVTVTKDALPRAMMAVRDALGDDVENPTHIMTARGRGYRFATPVASDAAPIAADEGGGGAFVGRESIRAIVRDRVERAALGRGALVLVSGASGMGKTRLLDVLCRDAHAAQPIYVRCLATAGVPELSPFGLILAQLARRGARLDPTLEAIANGTVPHAELDAPERRFRLFDRIAAAVAARGHGVLAIDDLHLADAASLAVLELLTSRIRTLPLVLLGAFEPSTRFRSTLAQLSREPSATVHTLEPLTRSDVTLYLEGIVGVAPSPAVIERVCEKTQGHPLLLSEVVPVLRAVKGQWEDVSTSAMVGGQTMRAAIERELVALPEETLHTLQYAGVFGVTFALAPLSAALGVGSADTLARLDGAERVVARAGEEGTYQFTYPLIRDVLYKQLSAFERARIHALAARALEDYAGGTEGMSHQAAGEIARHWVEAAAMGEVDRALDWSLRAARSAEDVGDGAAASTYAERGLRALRFAPKPDPERRARLVALRQEPPRTQRTP